MGRIGAPTMSPEEAIAMSRRRSPWWSWALALIPLPGGVAGAQAPARPWAANVVVPQARAFTTPGAVAVRVEGVRVGVVIRDRVATTLMEVRLRNPGAARLEAE